MGHSSGPTSTVAQGLLVIGGSAGSVEVIARLVGALPATFPGALAVVVHMPEHGTSRLAQVLQRSTALKVEDAEHDRLLVPGVVHVARPGYHLVIDGDHTAVVRGPRENGHRPSIDMCLRGAAEAWGERAVGVIVSGALSDGALGLQELQRAGGRAIVQDPAEAAFPGMPTSAIALDGRAQVLPAAQIPAAVMAIADSWDGGVDMAEHVAGPAPVSRVTPGDETEPESPGFGCPACGGALQRRVTDGGWVCRVGHGYSAEALDDAQRDGVEAALWSALRALRENEELNGRLERRANGQAAPSAARRFRTRAAEAARHARTIEALLGLPAAGTLAVPSLGDAGREVPQDEADPVDASA